MSTQLNLLKWLHPSQNGSSQPKKMLAHPIRPKMVHPNPKKCWWVSCWLIPTQKGCLSQFLMFVAVFFQHDKGICPKKVFQKVCVPSMTNTFVPSALAKQKQSKRCVPPSNATMQCHFAMPLAKLGGKWLIFHHTRCAKHQCFW